MILQRYSVVEKRVGETPLQALERFRSKYVEYAEVPLAYAGRLDPMASGKLLILIGDECKQQERYHTLDKEYEFEVLFGVRSDTGDILGRLTFSDPHQIASDNLRRIALSLNRANLTLPYPKFSSRTVNGKPLHIWTLEGRLGEIEIPHNTTRIHALTLLGSRLVSGYAIYEAASKKIETIPRVTDESKKLGADFRRADIREDWKMFSERFARSTFTIARFRCTCSSGTYMRSLAEHIGKELSTPALAYSIHRTKIGRYYPLPLLHGFWLEK